MTDICVNLSKLPTISDTNSWETFTNEMENTYTDWRIVLRFYWRDYRNWILFGLFILFASIIIVLIVVFQQGSTSYPCLQYGTDTFASMVSTDCLQYVWDANCRLKRPYLFPKDYQGWWKNSPQGVSMVSCRLSPSACGVGSYGNILVYMQFCQVNP